MKSIKLSSIFVFIIISLIGVSTTQASVFEKFRNIVGGKSNFAKVQQYLIIGVIVDNEKDSLEFVLHRILPDTLRLQVRYNDVYAITVITKNTGWTVDPTRKIYEPTELFPEEIIRMKSNILTLFSFVDENLFANSETYEFQPNDTNYLAFKVITEPRDTISYFIKKSEQFEFFKEVKFKNMPYVFKIYPSEFFVYEKLLIPRTIVVNFNDIKKTKMYIVNINFKPDIDPNLFIFKK